MIDRGKAGGLVFTPAVVMRRHVRLLSMQQRKTYCCLRWFCKNVFAKRQRLRENWKVSREQGCPVYLLIKCLDRSRLHHPRTFLRLLACTNVSSRMCLPVRLPALFRLHVPRSFFSCRSCCSPVADPHLPPTKFVRCITTFL